MHIVPTYIIRIPIKYNIFRDNLFNWKKISGYRHIVENPNLLTQYKQNKDFIDDDNISLS